MKTQPSASQSKSVAFYPDRVEEPAAIVSPAPVSIDVGTVREVLAGQLHAAFSLAKQLGVSAAGFATLTSDILRNELPESIRAGYASPGEGLCALLEGSIDVATATGFYRKPDPVTKSAITEKIRNGSIVAFQTGAGEYRVPVWQFRAEGGVFPGIAETLRALRNSRSYSQITPFVFLLQENPMTANIAPIEALKKGHLDAVLAAAHEYAS